LDCSPTQAGQTLLGLAISAELAHAHGGDLKLMPQQATDGTVFQLIIPDRVSELRPGRRGVA